MQWRAVVGYGTLYEVSDSGLVRSNHKGIGRHLALGRELAQRPFRNTRGHRREYPCVRLQKDGVRHYHSVHRLVAKAFLPNPLNLATVNHKNGNKLDNSVVNLEWASYRDNNIHALRTGLRQPPKPVIGEQAKLSKLTDAAVQEIRHLHKSQGLGSRKLHKLYNVGRTTIRNVLSGRNWSHVA